MKRSQQLAILIVEDSAEDREMYRRYLQKENKDRYIFWEAESGESALEIAREKQPDLILLDYLLPDMDGLEWLSLWQQEKCDNRSPVVVLTGQGDESIAVQFLKSGAADYLVKGQLTPEKLNLEVNRAIAESQLRIQHQEALLKLQLATVASNLGMWFWDLIDDELEWTEQCKVLFGIDRDTEVNYQLFLNILHPEDRERTEAAVEQALIDKTEYNIEYRAVWSDNSIHWLAAKGKGFYNRDGKAVRMMGTVQDISDRKMVEEALKKSKNELKLITEVIPQQIWTASAEGEIDYINQRWEQDIGISLEQVQSLGWETIIHPDDLPRVKQTWIEARHFGKKYNIELRLRCADKTYRWFLARATPLFDEGGKIIKWYGTNTDITPIKKLEEKLRQQTEDLIQANQLKDEFLAIVSHELRTPLNPILGWSQLIIAGKLDSEKEAMGVEIILRNARLQAQLIEDLLDVSRILRGKLGLQITPLDLESLIRAALGTVQLSAEAKSIQIKTEFAANIGQVLGDAGRLQQIFWNLLSNAIKFTPEGGLVNVKLERVGTHAQIQVQDTGKGIDANFLPFVFDRFRQAESSSTRKFGGLGLGLAIVRHLTELHGGTVSVISPGEDLGATFIVQLPLINPSIEEQTNSNPKQKAIASLRFQNLRVLVVDDELDSRDLLTLILEQEGATVTAVTSAREALESFDRSTPDLIISDIGMPEIDGYSLMRQIRQLSSGKNTPAIAITAYAGEVDRQHSKMAGYQKHIAKPIDITELLDLIMELIG